MTSTVPTAVQHADAQQPPITMFGPDFLMRTTSSPTRLGLGQIPATEHGTEVAVIGGGSRPDRGLRADEDGPQARRLRGRRDRRSPADRGLRGVRPVAHRRDGRHALPLSSTALQHDIDLVGLETRPFPNPLAQFISTVVDLKGESHYATTVDDLPQVYRDVMNAWNACLERAPTSST